MVGLSADNGGDLFGSTSGTTLYQIDGSTAPSGQVSFNTNITIDSNYQALDCIYSCAPQIADVGITKSVTDSTPVVGDSIVYTLTVTNYGSATATQLQVEDILPAGVTYSSDSVSQGSYDNATGLWYVGTLVNGSSAILTITVTVDSGPTGVIVTNRSSIDYLTQSDPNALNDTASVKITLSESNLSSSTKSVVDLNGGGVNPGDHLQYTITLIETGGTDATGVSLQDVVDSDVSILSVDSIPVGADSSSTSTTTLQVDNINVPENSTETVIFTVIVDAAATSMTNISNTAVITNPSGPGASPSSVTLYVMHQLDKELYLGPNAITNMSGINFPALSIGRLPFTSTSGIAIAGSGGAQSWTLYPVLKDLLTIDGSSNPGGVSVSIQLILSRGSSGSDRSLSAALAYKAGCAGGAINIGTTATTRVLSNPDNGPSAYTLSFNLTGDVNLTQDDCLILTLTNLSGGSSRTINVHPADGSGNQSYIHLGVFDFVNVDSVGFYDDAYPAGSLLTTVEGLTDIYIRAVVSDPFGSFDITGATFDLIDANLNSIFISQSMPEVNDSNAATKTYEYGPYNIPGSPSGTWDAEVLATEGTEGSVTHINTGVVELLVLLPLLNVVKSSDVSKVNSLDVITYSIFIESTGPGKAINVEVEDDLDQFTSIAFNTYGAGAPFSFIEGASACGLSLGTPEYSTDDGVSYSSAYAFQDGGCGASSGYDGCVTNFLIPMTGTMISGTEFTILYKMEVK
jgi:uncharacterized repeat protein (TIGR01451 family)